MEFSRNTRERNPKNSFKFLLKGALIFLVITFIVMMLNKIDLPLPNKEIKQTIPNENLKIVK